MHWKLNDRIEVATPEGISSSSRHYCCLPFRLELYGLLLFEKTSKDHSPVIRGESHDPVKLGTLCADAGLVAGGYNVSRWKFWRSRLHALSATEIAAPDSDEAPRRSYRGLQSMHTVDSGGYRSAGFVPDTEA
jgi:hypothetical protein